MKILRIGSRPSDLAMTQSRYIQKRISQLAGAPETNIITITTSGDRIQNVPLSQAATPDDRKGFFTKEIEDALLAGEIDAAVHSYKDLPTLMVPGLTIAAMPQREIQHDILVYARGKKILGDFPWIAPGSKIGTASVRRESLLKMHCPDMICIPLRGNVPTRIRKLKERADGIDAILLAGAGLDRLRTAGFFSGENAKLLNDLEISPLPVSFFVPAPAQGALGLQCRTDDSWTREILGKLHNAALAETVAAEREVLAALEGGCHLPLGAHCRLENQKYVMSIFLGVDAKDNRKGKSFYFTRVSRDAASLAEHVIDEIKKDLPVVLTGRRERIEEIQRNSNGKVILPLPLIQTLILEPTAAQKESFIKTASSGKKFILAVFSASGVESFHTAAQKWQSGKNADHLLTNAVWAVTGAETIKKIEKLFPGARIDFVSPDGTGGELAKILIGSNSPAGIEIIAVGARESRPEFAAAIRAAGMTVQELIVYRTEKIEPEIKSLQKIPEDCYIIFGSPSGADAFFPAYRKTFPHSKPGHRFCALGPTTADALEKHDIVVYAKSRSPDYAQFVSEL